MDKIGVGIVTYERFDMFKKCIESVLAHRRDIDELVVVEDCSVKDRDKYDEYFKTLELGGVDIFKSTSNKGVGRSKNKILATLIGRDCKYMFTIEDDMIIKTDDVFKKYIEVSNEYDIHYLNFAHHGEANKSGAVGRFEKVEMFPHCVGAFTLHTSELISNCGLYDKRYKNAWEHVDYYYNAAQLDLTTPFWMFADIVGSTDHIEEQHDSINKSAIRRDKEWNKNLQEGRALFKSKYGVDVMEVKSE